MDAGRSGAALERELVLDGLAAADEAGLAVGHDHGGGTRDGVVVRAHPECVGARGRHGQELSAAGLREGDALDEDVPGLAVLATGGVGAVG